MIIDSEVREMKFHGDQNDSCIDAILNLDDNERRKDVLNVETIKEEEEDANKQKFICLFSEGVKKFQMEEYEKIKTILKKKNIDLMVFNIANQNANMLYLKLLSEATPYSQFFTTDQEMVKFFQDFRHKLYQKRLYLEFF